MSNVTTVVVTSVGLAFGLLAVIGYSIHVSGDTAGYVRGIEKYAKDRQCGCGMDQTCVFGPGIIGHKHCTYDNTWSRCEPDPKYLVPQEGK